MHENSIKNLWLWHQGQSGNPNGRPISSRNRLTEQFLADVSATWHQHGAAILDKMAKDEPFRFDDLYSRLVPKDVQLTLESPLPGNLEPADWQAMLELLGAVKTAMPDDRSSPREIAQFVTMPSDRTAQNWEVVEIYNDAGISGAKRRDMRLVWIKC
jgi:Family of unknown function (DUF5681)